MKVILSSILIGCTTLLVFNVAQADEVCKKPCSEKDGLEYSICVVNNSVLDTVEAAIKENPKVWLMLFMVFGILVTLFRKVDTSVVIEFFAKSPDKIVIPGKVLDYMFGLWDRDTNSIIWAVVEAINVDDIDSQTEAKDRFENILLKHKARTIDALERMVQDDILKKIPYELNEVYDSWLSTLVNNWGRYRDRDTWFLIRQFKNAMNDQLAHYREEVKRKILA